MENAKYKAIIFDFFGVISSEVAPRWFKKHLPQEDLLELRKKYLQPADRGEISTEQLFSQLSKLVPITPENIRQEWLELAVIGNDMIEIVRKLKDHYKLAILSDSQSSFFREIIKTHDLEHLFNTIIVSSEINMTKANIETFTFALNTLGVKPEETIFTDDNAANVARAQSLGITGLVFSDQAQLKSDLSKLGISLS